jgi:hypothetical protein
VKPAKVLARAAILGVCCAAIAQLAILQPSALAAPTGAATAHPVTKIPKVKKPVIQLGAGIDLYTYPNQDWLKADADEVTYLKALNANSVMVSFPFFLSSRGSSSVVATAATPSPAQLAGFAKAAATAGLYVTLRPLMDQGKITGSRAGWAPKDIKTFFKTYQAFLEPYAKMAQQAGIPALYVGAEFSKFQHVAQWKYLVKALRGWYKGTLVYANNGPGVRSGTAGGVSQSVDAYPGIKVPYTATVRRLEKGWTYLDSRLPHHNVLSEVGIAGVRGAYYKSWEHHWPHPVMDVNIQVHWFQAACQAAQANHLGGIYFWAIGFGEAELQQTLSPQNQGAWEDGPAQKAVAACYKHIESLPPNQQ